MEQHVWDAGVAIGAAAFTLAFTWLANCISKSIEKASATGQKVTQLEHTVLVLKNDVEKMRVTLGTIEEHMRKWV
jgi:outer membrane murein-binding lipoprotein Lpp